MMSATLDQIVLGLVCFTAASYVVYRLRYFLRQRPSAGNWRAFVLQAKHDEQLDTAAFVHMFGEANATPHRVTLVLLLGWCWCLAKYPALLVPSVLYLVAGAALTRKTAQAARRSDYARLGLYGRLWFRLFYAWTWPLHAIKNVPPKAD